MKCHTKLLLCNVAMAIFAVVCATGCMSRAQHAAMREGFVESRTIADVEHREWSAIIAGDNNKDGFVTPEDGDVDMSKLPQLQALTPEDRNTWLQGRLREHEEYDKLIETSRDNDDLFGGLQ